MTHRNPRPTTCPGKLILSILFALLNPILKAADLELLQRTTVDTEALTFANGDQTRFGNFPNGVTHQQFPMRTYRGFQYTVYYDDERQVSVGRRKLPNGPWEVIRFTDYNITNNDTHNVAVIGICENDGTIHLTWDHHVNNLNYRRSVVGLANDPEAFTWSPELFGPVTDTLGPIGTVTQVTYPRFVSMPDGNLMLYYRFVTSGNGDSMIRVYNGNTSQWQTTHGKFIARDIGTYTWNGETSQFRYAYINGIGYAGNRLHCSWVWRDRFDRTDVNNQHDLCYAYSDDNGLTWKNSAGTQIAVTGSSFINVNSPGLIVHPIDPGRGVSNQNTQYAYPDGSIHVMLPRYRDGTTNTRIYHHHWRDAAGNWHWQDTGFQGSRPEMIGDNERNLFIIYTAGDNLRIAKGVPNAGLTAWNWSLIYNSDSPVTTAGDGQIDLSRWESERVLSVYGQEEPATTPDYGSGPSIDGLPTPLNVTDFQVSLQAAEPNPSHQALRVANPAVLQWTSGLAALSHRVYLGTDPNAVATASTTSPEYLGQQSTTTFLPTTPLAEGATYYWRIDSVESGAVVRSGKLWSFTTLASLPPTISTVPLQQIEESGTSSAIPVTIDDDLTPPSSLVLSASSSNPALIPNSSIVIAGSGSNRSVTITPTPALSGYSTITLSVNDGTFTTPTTFLVAVGTPPTDVFMAVLNSFRVWDDGSAWSDTQPAHSGAHYLVPGGGVLRSPDGASIFPGTSMRIQSGASVQVRSKQSESTITTIANLFLQGGSSFSNGDFAELIAGTGNDETNVIDGSIAVSGSVRFRGFAGSQGDNPRDLRVLSSISGTGIIDTSASGETSLHTSFIDNPANSFSGVWQVTRGRFEFASPETIGTADIRVLDHGELTIHGDWNQLGATLSVANSANAAVDLGPHHWTVSELTLGTTSVDDGSYSVSQLNALSDAVFSGSGMITVASLSGQERWRLEYFGTIDNSGSAADDFDANHDGEINLLEFATAQDPHSSTLATHPLNEDLENLQLTYTRSKQALADGAIFTVVWSDTLLPDSWSNEGVSESLQSQDSEKQVMLVSIPTAGANRRFYRLKVEL
jgi:hypothetical protein